MKHNKYWGSDKRYTNNLEVGMALAENMSAQQNMPMGDPGGNQYPEVIEVVENKIYFYADIDRQNILKLNRTIDTLNNDLLHKSIITSNKVAEIYLYINSFGGHIFDAFSTLDTVMNSKIPIYTVIDGCAASAATLISVVGQKRFIKPHSHFLIHQLSSVMWGKHEEFIDELQNQIRFMSMIKTIYKEHTNLPMKKLDEILKHDLWFDANDALKFGLADEILK
jgi:ATP-dependent Clp protease protease subunit